MRFENKEKRLELIEGFKEKAKSLTHSMKDDIPEDTEVVFETVTDYDEKTVIVEDPESEGKTITEKPGDIYVCYIKQPHIMTAIAVMDKLNKKDLFSAGYIAWDAMVIGAPHSSKEIEKYRFKLGLVGRLGFLLEMMIPDIKKN